MRNTLLLFAGAIAVAAPSAVTAQIYSTGPGFSMSLEGRYSMSLEGRYLNNSGGRPRLGSSAAPGEKPIDQPRDDKAPSGKATFDYRFPNNWDIGVSASGMKSGR